MERERTILSGRDVGGSRSSACYVSLFLFCSQEGEEGRERGERDKGKAGT